MTTDWQNFTQSPGPAPYVEQFAARMPDGRFLDMPLREIGSMAVADLIIEQASFLVVDALAEWLARACRPLRPDLVVGLPGRGAILAAELARRLSHANWVAVSDVPRPWFSDALSVPVPAEADGPAGTTGARWWLDPAIVPRLRGRRAVLVHDVLGPDRLPQPAAGLVARAGAASIALAAAVTQGARWAAGLPAELPVVAVFATPSFHLGVGGWVPDEGSALWRCCPLFRQGGRPPEPAGAGPPGMRGVPDAG